MTRAGDPEEIMEFGNGFMGHGLHYATVKKVATNAVMAGCKPEYMPVVLAIAESGACVGYPGDSSFGHLYIVSGPMAKEIGMNSGFCYLAPGNPANMAWADDAWLTEIDLNYIHLTAIDYTDARTSGMNGTSETENFLLQHLKCFLGGRHNSIGKCFQVTT